MSPMGEYRNSPTFTVRHGGGLAAMVGLTLILSACNGLTSETGGGEEPSDIELSDCVLWGAESGNQVEAQCGKLTVFEDRAAASGRTIELRIAVVPAVRRNAAPDPLFFLAGGPGQAATQVYPDVAFAFDRIQEERDIVLVDQRGTGGSNALDCPSAEEAQLGTRTKDELRAWASGCVAQLESHADLSLYTTSIAMDDLDDVRAALGYETINLYGGSYGTRAALAYVRQHPDRVRTVVLDSVVPPDLALGTTIARDAQHALVLFFARCAADADCRAAYPNLEREFAALMDTLSQGPLRVEVPHPVSAEPVELDLNRDMVAGALRFLSYAPETAALLPLIIHSAAVREDYELLAAQILLVGDSAAGAVSIGMHLSVICAEDVPFFEDADVRLHNADTYLADVLTDALETACAVWPRGRIPNDFKTPVRSYVPALILSGEADPVTPPEYGEAVAEGLPNSLHLVGPGQGHGMIVRGCIARLTADFVRSGVVDSLDTSCADKLMAPPFFVNFSGPVPVPPTKAGVDD